jgi:hypothetical protein
MLNVLQNLDNKKRQESHAGANLHPEVPARERSLAIAAFAAQSQVADYGQIIGESDGRKTVETS